MIGGKIIKGKTVKVGMYLRLSREDDDKYKESESITNQREFILNYIKENNYVLIQEYSDDGVTGTTFERKAFKRLIEDAKSGKINTIITKDLSRLGRNSSYVSQYIEEYFPENNIRYIAILDDVDTALDTFGNDMTGFKNLFNEQYAKDISKKVKASIYTKKRNGQFLGGVAPYGYKKDVNDKYKLVIDDTSSKVVKRIFDMFVNGYSLNAIAETLTDEKIPIPSVYKNLNRGLKSTAYGTWCTRTIGEILNNPTYIGNLTQCRRKKLNFKSKKIVRNDKEKWIIVENTHEPIIDEATFNIAQSLFNKNKGKNSTDILLKGFLYCKDCGHSIAISKNGSGKYYCSCNYYKRHSKRGLCTPHSCPYQIIEDKILHEISGMCKKYLKRDKFEDIAKDNNKKQKRLIDLQEKIKKAKNNIDIYNQQIDEAYRDKLNKVITMEQYSRFNEDIVKNIENEKELIQTLEAEYNCLILNITKKDDYTEAINNYLSFKEPNRQLLASLIDKIEIDEDKNIDIHFKIKSVY